MKVGLNSLNRLVNIFGPTGCGKTHLANILKTKIQSIIKLSKDVSEDILREFKTIECLIIDDYDNNIDEKLLHIL